MLRRLLACAVCLVVSGCGLVGGGRPVEAPSPAAVHEDEVPAKAMVSLVVLGNRDVNADYVVTLVPKGDRVKGQVTMNFCNGHFASEKNRVARTQVQVRGASGQAVPLSNEVVAYDTEKHAAAAMDELRSAIRSCPRHRWIKVGSDAMRLVSIRSAEAPALPVTDNVVIMDHWVQRSTGRSWYDLEIYQRKGNVLTAFYAGEPKRMTDRSINAVMLFAITGGARLART